jgi:hypothetical protein
MRDFLKPGGAVAFQTAEYSHECGRDWWYVGPDNGHISLYSRGALDHIFKQLGGRSRTFWREYPGVQAWQFGADITAMPDPVDDRLAAVYASHSWKVTAPLRMLGRMVRGNRSG